MLGLPLWASAIVSVVAKIVTQWLANRRAEAALRELGAKTQAVESTRQAEKQESEARRAGEVAQDSEDDPRDLRD